MIIDALEKGVSKFPIVIAKVVPIIYGEELIFKIFVDRRIKGIKIIVTVTSSMTPENRAETIQIT